MKKILILLLFPFVLSGQGIILETTSETLELLTSTANDIDYQINWVDIVLATGATPGASEGKITSATTTAIVAAPASSTYRTVKSMIFKNIHATDPNTLTIKKDISATEYQLTGATTLLAGESLVYTDLDGWQKMTSGGVKQFASVSFQVNVQTFTADGTWHKPTDFTPKLVMVRLWGGGGGGGAGASLASATIAKGGGGGGGGAYIHRTFLTADLGDMENVDIANGGAAGSPGAAGAAGGDGGVGQTSYFGTTYIAAYGGGGGRGGAITGVVTGGGGGGGGWGPGATGTTSGGAGGLPTAASIGLNEQGVTGGVANATNQFSQFGGAGGAGINTTPTGAAGGGQSMMGGGGGGAGGCHDAVPAVVQPGAGGMTGAYIPAIAGGGGAAGTSGATPTAGGTGAAANSRRGGAGGGGGGSTVAAATAGAAGGTGAQGGGGGGGGGVGMNPGLGGAGGVGGAGYCIITTW